MVRDGGAGAGKDRSKQVAVVNAALIRECIYIPPASGADDDRSSMRGGGFGGAASAYLVGFDKGREKDDARRQQLLTMELHEVQCLMCSFKGVSRIDNFVGVDNLVKLYLDNNNIAKIENLGHLKKLRWLNLSFNKITLIENLAELTELEDLSLYANEITAVGGLEALTKISCLSLGRNRIENLEDTAKYLHQFKNLRMLTLAGNKLDGAHYKSRLLGYCTRLKYLDNRLIMADEIAKAKESEKEHLMETEAIDKRDQAVVAEEAEAAKALAVYEIANAPNENLLFKEIFALEPEGRNIRAVLELDTARDKLKEIIDPYTERFLAKGKEMSEKMKDIRDRRKKDEEDIEYTMTMAKARNDEECKVTIRAFERNVKKVIPFGLHARPDPESLDELNEDVRHLHEELDRLHDDLLDREADQVDAFEAVVKALEDVLVGYKVEATEVLSTHFDELRVIEKQFHTDLKLKFDGLFDDRQRQQQDSIAAEDGGGAAASAGGGGGKDKLLWQFIENKEDYSKTLAEWGELHIKRLDEREEFHKKREEERAGRVHKHAAVSELARNRKRVTEIHAYVQRMREQISQWKQAALE